MISKSKIRSGKLPWGIEITQFVYLILSLLVTFVFVIGLFDPGQIDSGIISSGVMVVIYWALFYGTYKIKHWVVTLVLVFSTFAFISLLIKILSERPETIEELFLKAVSILGAIFFIFQLYIFTRPNTKKFFKDKGTTLIS